jgi:hypothetical protein
MSTVREYQITGLTVTENTVELIFGQERQPAHTVLLILPQIGLDLDRDLVLFGLASIQQLHEEFSFLVSLC